MDNQQLSLPYKEIKSVMGRKYYRDNFSISSKESYKIPVEQIQVREGYNKRRLYEDMESVVQWVENSTTDGIVELDPLPVIEVTDENEIYVLRGHRRLKGIHMAIAKGLKVTAVVCTPAPKDITEFDRVIDIYASNMNQSKLNAVEQADLCYDLKNNFGKISNEEIAKRIGVSRQQVDNLLILAGADDLTKQEIIKGNLNISDAIKSIRASKKAQEDADKKEVDANKTSASAPSPEPDPLADELKELKELEESNTPTDEELQQRELQRIAKEEKEREAIIAISDEIKVRPDTLPEHLGRKLSMPIVRTWVEDFIDEEIGEVVSIDKNEVLIKKDTVLTEEVIDQILFLDNPDTILVYKKGMEPVAKSVITVQPGEEEKSRFDESREEIQWIQNCIKLADKLEAITNKFDIPDGAKKDVSDVVKWLQNDLEKAREWINKNKKQNKAR